MQDSRIAAFKAFAADVAAGTFPQPRHEVDVEDEIFGEFRKLIVRGTQ